MHFLDRGTNITSDICFQIGEHITSDMCFLAREIHITKDVCSW